MKKLIVLLTCLFTLQTFAQEIIAKTDKEIYAVEGAYNFIITKTDVKTNKVVYKVETKIPDKSQKEMYYPGANHSLFTYIEDKIVIIYDIWHKSNKTKDCFVKTLNTKTVKFNEAKLLQSTGLNSVYSCNELIYHPVYSPDKTKAAILKDNISPTYTIEPEITIYDTKTFNTISTKKISGKYEGQKRIFELPNFLIDNNGNIKLVFSLMNEKTKVTTKSFSAEILFNESDLKNIKELSQNINNDISGIQTSHGQFYKTLEDYGNNKPIQGVRIKNQSFSWSLVGGSDFKLIDDEGNLKKEDTKNLPSDLFTYKRDNYSPAFLMRIIDKKPYIILVAGKLNFYSLYQDQKFLFYSEGWNGELEKYKENKLEAYLEKYDLLEDYKKDKPSREFKDNVNDYFNKQVAREIKYFELLNKKMK